MISRPILVALNKGGRAATGLATHGMYRVFMGQEKRRHFGLIWLDPERRSFTILGDTGCRTPCLAHPYEVRKLSIAEIKMLASYPEEFHFEGSYRATGHGSEAASRRY